MYGRMRHTMSTCKKQSCLHVSHTSQGVFNSTRSLYGGRGGARAPGTHVERRVDRGHIAYDATCCLPPYSNVLSAGSAPRVFCSRVRSVARDSRSLTLRKMAELLTNPLAELQHVFEAASPEALRTGEGICVAASLRVALSSPGASKAVPSLNACRLDQVAPGSLVRFYGMVQDVQDPEFYVGAYEEVSPSGEARLRTGKYRDMLDVQPNCTVRPRDDCTWQRTPVVCVPIPMQSEWAAREIAGSDAAPPAVSDAGGRKSTKRGASDAEECEDMDMESDAAPKKTQHLPAGSGASAGCAPCVPGGARAADGAADDPWSRATIGSCLVRLLAPSS